MPLESDIKKMKIQGASSIALASLRYLRNFSSRNGFGKAFDEKARKLEAARPTAVVLHNALEALMKSKSTETIDRLIARIEMHRMRVAFHGSCLIGSKFQVHTHCHSSDVMEIIKEAARKKKFTVVVDETRPRYQGLLTANELSKISSINVILITDSSAGMSASGILGKKDDIIIVGCDALRREGVVNKVGTYMLALAAKDNSIPFYVAASSMKIDSRKKIEIEMRPSSEVFAKKINGISVSNPAFDITPWSLVSGVITESGIKKSTEIMKMIGEKRI